MVYRFHLLVIEYSIFKTSNEMNNSNVKRDLTDAKYSNHTIYNTIRNWFR